MNAVVDFTDAYPECHNYAVEKLMEKFGPKGKCTLLDYVMFYGEAIDKFRSSKGSEVE